MTAVLETGLSQPAQNDQASISFGKGRISIAQINAIARQATPVGLTDDAHFAEKINAGVAFLDKLLKEDGVIYGVTTGYGDSVTVKVPLAQVYELPIHLTRFHGCGLGEYFSKQQGRAILATRLCSLSQGYSGVSFELLNLLVAFLNHDIVPRIPEEGSVGASGDLTPLSYIAGALIGEREVYYQGQVRSSADVMAELGLTPVTLRPKEGLAIMNGTAVMTALACQAYQRAEYLTRMSSRITALASLALQGNSHHYHAIADDRPWTHLRLNIYPDGGVARLRVITNYFTRMRFCTAEGKLDLKSKEGADTALPGYKPWFAHKERKTRDTRIIFGHWAALEGKCDEPGVFALDTGCVWGGAMTLMNIDTGERYSCQCESPLPVTLPATAKP